MNTLKLILIITVAAFIRVQFFQAKIEEKIPREARVSLPSNDQVSDQFKLSTFRFELENLIKYKQYDEAIAYLESNKEKIISIDPKYYSNSITRIDLNLAWLNYKSFGCEKSFSLFEKIASGNSTYSKLANKGLAICFLKAKDFWEAKQKALVYIKAHSKDIEAYTLITNILEHTLEYNLNIDLLIKAKNLTWNRKEREIIESLIKKVKQKIAISDQYSTTVYGAFNINFNQDINSSTVSLISLFLWIVA